jgi:hypothetical protein
VLSANPSAIFILEKYKTNIDRRQFSKNPAIFTYNYEMIRKEKKDSKYQVTS